MLEYKTMSMCASSDYCQGWNDAVKEIHRLHGKKQRLLHKIQGLRRHRDV